MRRLLPGRTTQALLAANALLAFVIVLTLLFPAGPDPDAGNNGEAPAAEMPSFEKVALNPPALAELTDMLGRPLFLEERRMPEPEAAEPPPPPTPLRLKLIGVAISGGSRVALLRNLVNNQLVQVAEGATHDGWTLEALSAQSAKFSRGPQVTELPLELEDKSPRLR